MEKMPTLMRAGDRETWNALIGRYMPQLTRFARRHVPLRIRQTLTPDDLVQEVVLRGTRQLHRLEFRHEQAFLSYLLKSIRHRIVDEIRRARCQPALVPLDERAIRRANPAESQLQRLVARENVRGYAKALGRLAERDRQLIMLRIVKRLPCRTVAARLGMNNAAAVHMAAARALRRLKRELEACSHSGSRALLSVRSPCACNRGNGYA